MLINHLDSVVFGTLDAFEEQTAANVRYIPTVTVFSGAVVGFLAAGADMIGTVGQSSGTGVLLTVGIMIRMYEQIGKEQMMEMHPVLRSFFGEE